MKSWCKNTKSFGKTQTFAKFFWDSESKVSSVKSVIKVFWLEKRVLNNILLYIIYILYIIIYYLNYKLRLPICLMTLLTNDTLDTLAVKAAKRIVKYVYNREIQNISWKYVSGNRKFQGLKVWVYKVESRGL